MTTMYSVNEKIFGSKKRRRRTPIAMGFPQGYSLQRFFMQI